jgi:hypothetical protein
VCGVTVASIAGPLTAQQIALRVYPHLFHEADQTVRLREALEASYAALSSFRDEPPWGGRGR